MFPSTTLPFTTYVSLHTWYYSCTRNAKLESSMGTLFSYDDGNQEEDERFKERHITGGSEIARYFDGKHETEISEDGEAGLDVIARNCEKNPGHAKFIPIKKFTIDQMPRRYRNVDVFHLIKAIADLTVRISVGFVSPERPQFFKDTGKPYPFYDKIGSEALRTGTGMVDYITKITEQDGSTCPCVKCVGSTNPSKVWAKMTVTTATHVVFNEEEAKHAGCRLFFDDDQCDVVKVDVVAIMWALLDKDLCKMVCVTCDGNLVDKLVGMVRRWRDLRAKVHDRYSCSRSVDTLTAIVSHPHGCHKHVTLGVWTKRLDMANYYCRYGYNASTCKGSSGAPVCTLGSDWRWLFIHSGTNPDEESFNYSGTVLDF